MKNVIPSLLLLALLLSLTACDPSTTSNEQASASISSLQDSNRGISPDSQVIPKDSLIKKSIVARDAVDSFLIRHHFEDINQINGVRDMIKDGSKNPVVRELMKTSKLTLPQANAVVDSLRLMMK